MPQIGRHTSWNDPTSFGSEITRLTGELLADTTQMVPYIQITWEPRLKTSTSLDRYPKWPMTVDLTNMWTSGEMSVWIAQREPGIKKGLSIWLSTVLYRKAVISMEAFQTKPYTARTTLVSMAWSIPNFDVLQAKMQRLSSGLEALYDFLIPDPVPVKKQEVHLTQADIYPP